MWTRPGGRAGSREPSSHPSGGRRIAAAHGNTPVSALGILFNTGAGQHILKNPLVVNSIIDKVGAAAEPGLAGGAGKARALRGPPPWLRPSPGCGGRAAEPRLLPSCRVGAWVGGWWALCLSVP